MKEEDNWFFLRVTLEENDIAGNDEKCLVIEKETDGSKRDQGHMEL